eukprot:g327.t1
MFDTNIDLTFGLVPTRFVWRYGGHQVSLVGSFTRWVQPVPLLPVDGNVGYFSVVVHLAPGYHQYKFIVDGVWRHDENVPFMPDPLGNVNNWVFVRKPEPTVSELDLNFLNHQRLVPRALNNQIIEELANRAVAGPSEDIPMQEDLPHLISPRKEPEYTLSVIHEFLHGHKGYELIPESGKVVVFDIDLSVRQAFHALHEQNIPSASLWDSEVNSIVGVISASDFIEALKKLRESVSSGGPAMSAAEMDRHTIRNLKQTALENGSRNQSLVSVEPEWNLLEIVKTLIEKNCSMVPIVSRETNNKIPTVLHVATIGSVLSCLMHHFQASLSSLPLLSRPIEVLQIGTWSPSVPFTDSIGRKIAELNVVRPETPLTDAFSLLLEADVTALPVVNEDNVLLDVYSRTDITQLVKNQAYTRLQEEEMTVQQALAIGREPASIPEQQLGSNTGVVGGLTASFRGGVSSCPAWSSQSHLITRGDTLRTVVERLAAPGIHQLMIIEASHRTLEGIITLTDVAQYLFMKY